MEYSTKVPYSGSATTPHVAVVPLHPLEQRKTIFTHIVWMAHHKQMAHLYENDSRFE